MKQRMTLILEGDELPSFNFSQEVLGCKVVSASLGDAIEERDDLQEELDSIKGKGAEQ